MKSLFTVIIISIFCVSCKKGNDVVPPPVSFIVANAINGSVTIIPQLGGSASHGYFNGSQSGANIAGVDFGRSRLYSIAAGTTSLLVVPSTDTTHSLFNGSINTEPGGIYSLYLSGDLAHPDTMLVKENIPAITDSTAGVRFVNLTAGGKTLSFNLDTDPNHSEFASLGYKNITGFKKYNAQKDVGGHYVFEIRDHSTGELLTSYTWTYARFRCTTIVIAGSTDPLSPNPLIAFGIKNFLSYN